MFNVGLFEFIFFVSFALIFLGPEKLLELLKTVYQFYQKIRAMLQSFQSDMERELKLNELQLTLESEINKVKDLEKILSQKIYADLSSDTPVHISLPYSSLGKIEKIIPLKQVDHPAAYPLSYAALNDHLLHIPSHFTGYIHS
ncbi:Sec-independent protein translocase subunit TatA/TatB [Acinetobacter chinensis]|jgi:Tat protein translocase TatB subunit|uniref:Sec-independent protein translocase subunit TatA/TatB n=1 Tax=Acinetobacter chinensis TaxID=2004650 RepID=UPI0029347FF2|nr:hypothetical protein [Acinetobacter chinensis]WOE43167.1 hypothetical protein QSG87_08630 [Acinetobacter chinensis]